MISHHEKFRFTDENKKTPFFMEVNWNPKDKKSNQAKIIKVIHPDGTETYIKREHFNAFLFAIGKPSEQREMIPQKQQTVRTIETTLGIKATKDIRKGERINVPVKLDIPINQQEIIGKAK